MRKYIAEGLEQYLNSGFLAWHMPGHKRKSLFRDCRLTEQKRISVTGILDNVMQMDVTEVPGTDDLHHPEHMIRESMEELKRIYGSYASYYLVNGSTCGIFAAIAACAVEKSDGLSRFGRGSIIIARNCHKSVHNAAALMGLQPVYIEPVRLWEENNQKDNTGGIINKGCIPQISGGIEPEALRYICAARKDIRAMVITSPTYEGVVSDIEQIAEILKEFHIKLIVDEAHGAHLPFMEGTPKSAIDCGADLVVQSLHKTLPSLTQTAILHVMNQELERPVREYLSVFMSSSPSYLLLCSMEQAVAWAKEQDYGTYIHCLADFRRRVEQLRHVHILSEDDVRTAGTYDYDITRIVIWAERVDTGKAVRLPGVYLEKRMSELGQIVCEMSGTDYVVLISTAVDTEEDFAYLYDTLMQLENEIAVSTADDFQSYASLCSGESFIASADGNNDNVERQEELIRSLVGNEVRESIYVYPPGSYILTAGEIMTEAAAERLIMYVRAGKKVHGI